jgi:D-alanyl-D-alanine carboxypeptidase/D-alanyl-D-alanine-endopeptidase (penicillin-binding protein 4)
MLQSLRQSTAKTISGLIFFLFALPLQAPLFLAEQARNTSRLRPASLAAGNSAAPAANPREAHRRSALDKRIDKILAQSDARRGSWGIDVIELESGKPLYERDAGHLFIPASNMKMFTTAAALEKLGPGYTFHTTAESDAAPDAQGRVANLYLVGRGDPDLGPRTFPYIYHGLAQSADTSIQQMADQVKARGVREITGNLIADDTYFVDQPFAANWAADDLEWGYGAPVTALAFNDNQLTLDLKPAAKVGDPALASLSPIADYYLVKNRVVTGTKGTEADYHLERRPGSMEIDLWGQIPVDGGDQIDTVSIADPPRLAAELFRAALGARGIQVDGSIEVRRLSPLDAATLPNPATQPAPRIVLADHASPALSEAIKVVNKESQNLHAEMLLRTIGRSGNQPGSLESGLSVLTSFLNQQVGILPGEMFLSDGSGLSRQDLVAPEAAVKLLVYMAHSPNFQAYFDSLPVSGIDGTLAHRFLGDEVKGRIHAKTGSVEHVNTLSGYMDLPSGKRLVFSIMTNNHPLPNKSGQQTLDAVTLEIYKWFSRRR